MLTPIEIIKNWSQVVAPKIQPTGFVRTYGSGRALVAMLPVSHRPTKWDRRAGGWCSKVPTISYEARKVFVQAYEAVGERCPI